MSESVHLFIANILKMKKSASTDFQKTAATTGSLLLTDGRIGVCVNFHLCRCQALQQMGSIYVRENDKKEL